MPTGNPMPSAWKATTCAELPDGWIHSVKKRYDSSGLKRAVRPRAATSQWTTRLEHKYVSPEKYVFKSLSAASRFLGIPIVRKSSMPKSSVRKSSMPKSSVPKSSVSKSSVPRKAKSSVEASVDPLSEYEKQNQKNIARNMAFLRKLGLVDDALGIAEKVAPRAKPRTTAEKFGHLGKRSSDRLKANGFA